MSSSPPWKFASLFCIWQLGNSSYTGQNLEWPTDSLYRSTKPSSSLQNLLLSGFLLLQGPSIAWNKQNSADLFTLHCVHNRLRTLNFYLVLLYTVRKQCDVNSSLVPVDHKPRSKQYGSALSNQWRLSLLGFTEPMKFAVIKPCQIPQC